MGLSIGEVSRRTGLSVAVLRMWQQRHGFPALKRTVGRHRRYSETDVAAIVEVRQYQQSGMQLRSAIEQVRSRIAVAPVSIHALVRSRHPGVPVQRLRKSTLVAMSRAIEDEYLMRGGGVLYGAFQREQHYRAAQPRWAELARTATAATVFADFTRNDFAVRPVEIAVAPQSPMSRDWVLVAHTADLAVVLTGAELLEQDHAADSDRLFETVWTVDPDVVQTALEGCAALTPTDTDQATPVRAAPTRVELGSQSGVVLDLARRILAYTDRPHP